MSEPEQTERPAEAIYRQFGVPLPPVGTWFPMKQQARTGQHQARRKHPEEKTVSQGDEQEQLAAWFPVTQTQGLDEQFGFLKAELFLNFPT